MITIASRADKAGACNTQKAFGVEVGANFGAELAVKAANVNDPGKELLELKIAVGFLYGFESLRSQPRPKAGN